LFQKSWTGKPPESYVLEGIASGGRAVLVWAGLREAFAAATARKTISSDMKKMVLLLGLGLAGLCGCTHQYTMKLNNGMTVTTDSKPKLRGNNYYFQDASGRENVIPQSRVRVIEPSSMAAEENKFHPSNPKQRHWYLLWLG
jgi:hypothetical protein